MANNETKAPKDDRVELFVPKGYANDDPNFFISINGVNYLLPRGKTSMVPEFVKAEYERAMRAANKQDERVEQMLEASK
jgi:hypothetical protein